MNSMWLICSYKAELRLSTHDIPSKTNAFLCPFNFARKEIYECSKGHLNELYLHCRKKPSDFFNLFATGPSFWQISFHILILRERTYLMTHRWIIWYSMETAKNNSQISVYLTRCKMLFMSLSEPCVMRSQSMSGSTKYKKYQPAQSF